MLIFRSVKDKNNRGVLEKLWLLIEQAKYSGHDNYQHLPMLWQNLSTFKDIPQNHHTFALFDHQKKK